jgi:hypothetical protein
MDVKVEDGKLVVTVPVSDEDGVRKLVGALGLNTVLTALLGLKPVAPATKPGPKSGPKPTVPPGEPKV